MAYSVKNKSLILIFFSLLLTLVFTLPTSAAEVEQSSITDTSPKYVEIVRLFHFAKGGGDSPVPMSYFHLTYFPAGRFTGVLPISNPVYTFTFSDGTGYHEVTYKGYVYFTP
ncbi:hypothetical protein [Paenibacillus sp. O199]|uniref:hypothetical protein n=1 Tax=Paenibacillus sp. O199 TaxID=1643925 RepID=UPI0007BEC6E5|nr:hypothetical protein [Paenibacillus sp. O199]